MKVVGVCKVLVALALSVSPLLAVADNGTDSDEAPDSLYNVTTTCIGDSIAEIKAVPAKPLPGNWITQLLASGFHINDPRINYPSFARWLVKVYNWGDRTFNSYDPEYVVGTGRNWKAIVSNYLWSRTYVMHFNDNSLMHISSKLYYDIGANVNFMAVGVGYTFKINDQSGDNITRHRFDLSFTCSKFASSFTTQKVNGGAIIRKFGDYNGGKRLSYDFNDIDIDNTSFDLYYFFNNRKYSQAAAYCYSKYQLKSAGSWILGFNYLKQNINMNFENLPPDMIASIPSLERQYSFSHTDYNVLGGYAYNWVLRPKIWLINITVLPSLGYKHSSESSASIRDLLSTNIEGLGAVVYNHDWMFSSLSVRFNGYVNFGKSYTFFNSNQLFTLNFGVRF